MKAEAIQKEWTNMLDSFQRAGMNAVIFQVRPQADAFYESKLEPWSRYLTGEQGKAPNPAWDPLAFMIEECHKRGMQLHEKHGAKVSAKWMVDQIFCVFFMLINGCLKLGRKTV